MESNHLSDNRKLQLIQVSIVEDIDRICQENDLTYYMIAGTLLGAVRHKGFIPWDDDMDLVMYRDDYNKLIGIIQRDYADKYFAQTFYTDKEYTRYVLKIRLNGTRHVESAYERSSVNQGIYIDIFPLDHVKKPGGFGLSLRGKLVRLLFAYKSLRFDALPDRSPKKVKLAKATRWTTYLLPNRLVNRLFDYVCGKDNKKNCAYTTNFASHYRWQKQLFKNEVYGVGCPLEFEGRLFNAPTEYETVLRQLYGDDYMAIPPKEKQITHEIVELDFGAYEPTE